MLATAPTENLRRLPTPADQRVLAPHVNPAEGGLRAKDLTLYATGQVEAAIDNQPLVVIAVEHILGLAPSDHLVYLGIRKQAEH